MKTYIKTLWGNDPRPLWFNDDGRNALRLYLNDLGFYVLTGAGDSLEVYAIENLEPFDIRLMKKALDKISKTWYFCIAGMKKV